jgi:hypothetical protein
VNVPVVQVGPVGVRVGGGLVRVLVTVAEPGRQSRIRLSRVLMTVVLIVMPMPMNMADRLVSVGVFVSLGVQQP